jgi:GT2 family glycosyltransferase
MSHSSRSGRGASEYIFRFDAPIESRIFGEQYDLSGWLLHSGGKPITGIRAIVKHRFARRHTFAARRKRTRLDVAEAFPHLPEAKKSGFLFELRLRPGRNDLTLQVREEDRTWRTFHTTVISAYPLSLLGKLGFRNLQEFFASSLQKRRAIKRSLANQVGPTPVLSVRERPLASPRTKRVDLFATTKSNLFILEIGQLIAAGFREIGCESRLFLDEFPNKHPGPDTLQLIVTPHEYYNLFLTEKVSLEEACALTRNVVLFCTEQPETGWFHNNLPWAEKARAVADLNALGVAAYQARGLESYHLPLGYHEMLAAPDVARHSSREIDITFLGVMTSRREEFFAEHAPFFAERHCHIRFVPLGFAKTKLTRSYLSEERRNELLNRSRLLLNIHYSDRQYFEPHRALVALANRCCLITETSEGYGDLVPGKHFVMADREDLLVCCDYYLAHRDEAEAIAQAGYDFVRTQRRQAQTCRDFLLDLESGRSKLLPALPHVSADARALPSLQALTQLLRKRRLRRLKDAVTTDLQNLFRRKEIPSVASFLPEPDVSSRPFIVAKREAYQERWLKQEFQRASGKTPWDLYDNAPYGESATPKLSVIVTLFNYAHHIHECLTSIERAAGELIPPPEIVIVDDASTDDSLAVVRSHQESSKLAIRIAAKHLNTGLADARNVGAKIARAPFVFVMDADNLVFRKCLTQLLDAIERDNYAAAYSLLCRFRGTTSNRVGLLSYYDWDPQILVQRPFIDAMAMFRREALLELGGYDNQLSQIGWFGWEDYDMWLRFAQNNYAVAFVPNILCLYRHHDRSMINLTNMFESELVEHFLASYGDLVGRFEPRETVFGVDRNKIATQ